MKILWTDGSASPNPGPGGYAVIEVRDDEAKPVVLGRDKDTTNIRMEGSAMIAAIKYAGEEGCEIHSDSEFWINVLTKWAPTWQEEDFWWKHRRMSPRPLSEKGKPVFCENSDFIYPVIFKKPFTSFYHYWIFRYKTLQAKCKITF